MMHARFFLLVVSCGLVTGFTVGCGGGVSQSDMMKYARAGSGGGEDDQNDPPRQVASAATDASLAPGQADRQTGEAKAEDSGSQETGTAGNDSKGPEVTPQQADDDDAVDPSDEAVRRQKLGLPPKSEDDDEDAVDPSDEAVRRQKLGLPPKSDDDEDAVDPSDEEVRRQKLGLPPKSEDDANPKGGMTAGGSSVIPPAPRRPTHTEDEDGDVEPRKQPLVVETVKAKPPEKKVLEKTMAELRQIYQVSWDQAKTPVARRAFADELKKKADTMSDVTVKYALLLTASRIASHAAFPQTAIACVEELDKHFEVDAHEMKMEVVEKTRTLKANDTRIGGFLEKMANELFDESFQRDEFDDATMLFAIRQSAARRSGNAEKVQELAIVKRRLELAKSEYKKMKKTLETLAEFGDLKANTVAGAYYCFVKENWARGLMMLASGPTDDPLSVLAKDEIAGAATAEGWIAIADRWWDFAADDENNQRSIRLHAVYIYEQAIPDAADGVGKLRAEVRVKQARKILGDHVVDNLEPRLQRSFGAEGSAE